MFNDWKVSKSFVVDGWALVVPMYIATAFWFSEFQILSIMLREFTIIKHFMEDNDEISD